jgi:hypothetical protein
MEDSIKLFADAYPVAYQTLYEAKPITCSATGTTFDALPPPCAAILDVSLLMYYGPTVISTARSSLSFPTCTFQFFAFAQLQATRAVSGRSVPIIVCVAAGAAAIIRLFGPEYLGGRGDMGVKIDAEVARTGLSDGEIGDKVHFSHHAFRRNK